MNKKKIAILILLFALVAALTLTPTTATKGYTKYKGTVKLKAGPSYSPEYGPTYKRDGFRKEWRSGKNGNYVGSAEIYLYKKGKKVTKNSYLRFGQYSGDSQFKIVVKFRYWNGYKYTNKYKTKTYYKKYGLAYAGGGISSTNWIPYYVKVYTK